MYSRNPPPLRQSAVIRSPHTSRIAWLGEDRSWPGGGAWLPGRELTFKQAEAVISIVGTVEQMTLGAVEAAIYGSSEEASWTSMKARADELGDAGRSRYGVGV